MNEKTRMNQADRWVEQIMQPILASGLVDKLLRCSRMLEADGDLEWLEDLAQGLRSRVRGGGSWIGWPV